MAATPRADAALRVFNLSDGSDVTIPLSADAHSEPGHWSHYFAAVARRVARNFPGTLVGADLAVISDLPQAAGMSSSSACVVGTFLLLDHLNDLRQRSEYRDNIKSKEDLAGYLGTIENGQTFGALAGDKGVGTFGGSQDHTSILCAKPGRLAQYCFAPVAFERFVPLPAGYVFAVAVSGVVAEKTREARDKYNQVSLRAREILGRWRESSGRNDPTLAVAIASSPDAPERISALLRGESALLARFEQFIEESTRIIPAVAEALAAGNFAAIGPLIDRSQERAEWGLGNQVPETIFLARSAREIGAAAASAFGAGFGGSVWALTESNRAEAFLSDWSQRYRRQFPDASTRSGFFLSQAGPSAAGPLL
jgi:galactokinase